MNKMYTTGSIISATYNKIPENVLSRGVFCVLYDEAYDKHISHSRNILAIKVTSKLDALGTYSVFLNGHDKNPFLKENSFAQCSKIHTLDKINNDTKYLGRLDDSTIDLILFKVSLLIEDIKKSKGKR